jgi:hypothetical protein
MDGSIRVVLPKVPPAGIDFPVRAFVYYPLIPFYHPCDVQRVWLTGRITSDGHLWFRPRKNEVTGAEYRLPSLDENDGISLELLGTHGVQSGSIEIWAKGIWSGAGDVGTFRVGNPPDADVVGEPSAQEVELVGEWQGKTTEWDIDGTLRMRLPSMIHPNAPFPVHVYLKHSWGLPRFGDVEHLELTGRVSEGGDLALVPLRNPLTDEPEVFVTQGWHVGTAAEMDGHLELSNGTPVRAIGQWSRINYPEASGTFDARASHSEK